MSVELQSQSTPRELPIREDLFVPAATSDGGPMLVGSRCRQCGTIFFPQEAMCPIDIVEGTLERVELNGAGTLISFTRVMRGLPGFDSPYVLAIIALKAGPTLLAQLEDWQDKELKLGMPVELVIGRIKRDQAGNTIIGPKFRPLSN